MFEPEVFRKQMYSIEVGVAYCTCAIVRSFRRPMQSFGALIVFGRLENCAVRPPSLRPDYCVQRRASTNHGTQF